MGKWLIVVLVVFGSGCAMDDWGYDIEALHPKHQEIVLAQMDWWNAEDPAFNFYSNPGGDSSASYGPLGPWVMGIHYPPGNNFESHRIVFNSAMWIDEKGTIGLDSDFCGVARHEFGHHLLDHSDDPVNPMHTSARGCGNLVITYRTN